MRPAAIKYKIERKVISISEKRQLTIPQKYYNALGFDNEAECILSEEGLLIRPVHDAEGGALSKQILASLIANGYDDHALLDKFKEQSRAIRSAVQKLLEEADALAKSGQGRIHMDKLFGKPK